MAENDSDVEELERSLHNMSLDDDDEVELGCFPTTSTPKKDQAGKHALTPDSMRQIEPISKRLQTSESPFSTSAPSGDCGGKPTSSFYKQRRESYVNVLLKHFEERKGSHLKQDVVLEVLQLNEFQKIQATNAIKQAFPNSMVIRKASGNDKLTFYRNVGHKSSFSLSSTPTFPSAPTSAPSSLELNESAEITNLKELIISTSSELDSVSKRLDDHLSGEEIQKDTVKVFLRMQRQLQIKIQELQDNLTTLLQKEVSQLLESQSHCEALCAHETKQLNKEMSVFIEYLNTNIESKTLSEDDFSGMFSSLTGNVRENCPLLFNVLDTILLHKNDGREVNERRVKSAVHSLAILVSLRSQKIPNDFKLMFTCLCISFGAGHRFISMLNHLGLTVSWEKAMKFFDSRRLKQKEDVTNLSPADIPVILMMDNINIYRGKRKHLRLFKSLGPTMWNFTAQAVLIPNVDGMEKILEDKEACLFPQGSATEMKPEDIFLESDQEKASLFSKAVDQYLLEVLHVSLNKIPLTVRQLKEMTELQLNSHLKTAAFQSTAKYNINVPKEDEILTNTVPNMKSNVHILPLSLEDNSTVLGTMSILDNLSEEFSLPNEKRNAEYLPFDCISGNFDVVKSRSHFELLLSQKSHHNYMKNTENQMRSSEKALDGLTEDDLDNYSTFDEEYSEDMSASNTTTITLEHEKQRFEIEDKPFWEAYNSLTQKLLNVAATNSEESYMNSVDNQDNRKYAMITDHLKRSMLHVAVEQNNGNLVKYLVDLGLDVNAREGCGMTPLSLAVLEKNIALCRFLVESGACFYGPLFTSIPSPLVMAKELKLSEIQHIFDEDKALSDEEDLLIQTIDSTFTKKSTECPSAQQVVQEWNRTCSGFVTPVVGDVGTCKTNSAAMSRSASYQWVGLCPGDLHNKGYFCEAVFKVHGSSGFHYLWSEVMKRKRLTAEVFKKKKFQENNLVKVREAINDACRSYGIAAALEFADSSLFPSREELIQMDNTSLLLTGFKEWLLASSKDDIAFQHRATAFLFYGPLQKLYDTAIAYGDGFAREAVYQAQVPMYAQLGFRNYYTEVLRHIVNFLVKWPTATRILLQKNCCINLLGKKGHGIELDAFVEAEVVQPLKKYVSGHTTVGMCERLMSNLDTMKYMRRAYMDKEGFDVHPTSRHSVQSPLPDQLKGAWFCLQKRFFEDKKRQEVECYPLDNKGCAAGKVPKNLLNVVQKGKDKIKESFKTKMYESFSDLRYKILME